jgi:hypothetical protein
MITDEKQIKKLIEYFNSKSFICIPLLNKRPILKKWNELTHTPSKFALFTNHNIGVLTGRVSGITVLDIDIKDDGIKTWKLISSVYPNFVTPMSMTPNKGLHLYFKYNNKLSSFSRFKLNDKKIGWDLLNNDRQAVLPPSVDDSSKRAYKWIISLDDAPLIEMPIWLEQYLLLVKNNKS